MLGVAVVVVGQRTKINFLTRKRTVQLMSDATCLETFTAIAGILLWRVVINTYPSILVGSTKIVSSIKALIKILAIVNTIAFVSVRASAKTSAVITDVDAFSKAMTQSCVRIARESIGENEVSLLRVIHLLVDIETRSSTAKRGPMGMMDDS